MPFWHDPLEELITELERAVPAQQGPHSFGAPPPFDDLQIAVHAVLRGRGDDPEARAVVARLTKSLRAPANAG